MHIDFLAIGELLADVMTVNYTTDLSEAKTFEIFQGGSPANVVANLRFMGKDAALISCVGNDGIGKFLRAQLKNISIPEEYLQSSNLHPTSLVLVSRSRETPDFIAYRMADRYLHSIDEKIIRSASIIHTTAFALSLQPARRVILSALKVAKKSEKTISVDWNFAPEIWGKKNGKDVFKKIMKFKPILKISLDDLKRFLGEKPIDGYKKYLDTFNCNFTCLTCGKDGVWYKKSGKEWIFKDTIKVDEVVDTTGAGDAFWAGFISGLIEDLPVNSCIDRALYTAAKKIQQTGPLYNVR